MAQITYTYKEDIYEDSSIPVKNKVVADDMNEIKTVVNDNENKILIAMSDTAPAQCSTGDLYYNTTSKKIFEATGTNTWGTTGTNPTSNTIYILFDTKTTYSYDGTDLVSVGGGGAEISVQTTEPTGEDADSVKLWINPNLLTNQAKYKDGNTWKTLSIKALDSMPIGAIIQFMGSTIPNGWLVCDGSTLDDETYPELHEVIGGSGSTFTIPNFKGRVAVGYDSTDIDFNALGKTGGSKELQAHTHTYNISTQGTTGSDGRRLIVWNGSGSTYDNASGAIQNAGTGDSGNLQPYLVVNYIIKAKNTTPTMASIVNTQNDSTTDGYSCKYINDLHTYSNNEKRVGTFVDGKPTYRKTIYISGNLTYDANGYAYIDTNISNIDVIIDFTGQAQDSTSGHLPIPYINVGRLDYGLAMSMTNDNRIVVVNRAYDNPRLAKFVFNLEYTKTTD